MSISLLTVVVLLGFGDDLPDKAAEAFTEGLHRREAGEKSRAQFRAAVAAYEKLRQEGANNARLFRNLGNARLLAGDLPGAILAYRQGLRVEPNDRMLRRCLAEARQFVVFREGSALGRPAEDNRPPWLPWLGANGWLSLAVLGYAGGCAAVTRWRMLRHRGMLLAGAVLLTLATGIGMVLWRHERSGPDRPVVVIAADGVLLRKGNGTQFPPRYETPLNRGVEAELLFRRDGWLQIELSGGAVGWVAARDAVDGTTPCAEGTAAVK